MKPIITTRDTTAAASAARTALPPSIRWGIASLSLSMLLSSLGTGIANVGLPTLTQAFNASFQQLQWGGLADLLAITTLIVSVGRLGDLVGRRRLLLAGIALFTLASIVCGFAPELWLLIAARAAQGLGAAIMMALTMAFVGETVPKSQTGSAMGLLGTMSAVGTALVALTLATYALDVTLGHGRFGLLNVALLVVAVVSLGLFLLADSKAASPLIRLDIFRNPVLSAGFAMSALVTTVIMAPLL